MILRVALISIDLSDCFGVVGLDSRDQVLGLRRTRSSKFILIVSKPILRIYHATSIHRMCRWQRLVLIGAHSLSSDGMSRVMVSFTANLAIHHHIPCHVYMRRRFHHLAVVTVIHS